MVQVGGGKLTEVKIVNVTAFLYQGGLMLPVYLFFVHHCLPMLWDQSHCHTLSSTLVKLKHAYPKLKK